MNPQPISKCLLITVLFMGIFLFAQPLHAQDTCTATGGAIGNWSLPSDWDCSHEPTAIDDVIIPSGITMRVNVPVGEANNVTIQNGGTLQLGQNAVARTLQVNGNLVIDAGGILQPSSIGSSITHVLEITGNFTNNGTFSFGGNNFIDVTFLGSNSVLNGSTVTRFNNLLVTDAATVTFPGGALEPTVEVAITQLGTLIQTQTVNNANVAFLELTNQVGTIVRYRGVNVDTSGSGANLGAVTVTLEAVDDSMGEYCTQTGAGSPTYADRCYNITPTTSGTALIRLWATTAELNSIAEANLAAFHDTSGMGDWTELTVNQATGNDGAGYHYSEGQTTSFSPFLLGGINAPTAVSFHQLSASFDNTNALFVISGLLLLALMSAGVLLYRRPI